MDELVHQVRDLDPRGAADKLDSLTDTAIAQVLAQLNPGQAVEVLRIST